MIAAGNATAAAPEPAADRGGVALDEILSAMARRRPEAPALADAPNREAFTSGAPRRLTFAAADRAVTAIAGRLAGMELPPGTVVGIQLPNIVEYVLAILGVMRAGMIAAPLPLLWRRADAISALARIGAKALITTGHVGGFHHAQLAMRVAADVFSICYVGGFGADLPDGVVAFDDLLGEEQQEPALALDAGRQSEPTRSAVVTFEVGAAGIVPVVRNHLELLAGGLAVFLESGLRQEAGLIGSLAPSSFAGLSLTLLPWLLCGGALSLHHPFDADVLARQWQGEACADALILPGAVALRLAQAGLLARETPGSVLAAWRAPDRIAAGGQWHERDIALVDVAIFGEAGLVAARRAADGKPALLPYGPITAPRGSADGIVVAELLETARGTVALRGPMVPHRAEPSGVERPGLPRFEIGPDGLVDTGFPCRVDHEAMTVAVTGPPPGIAAIGGCRIPLRDLQDAAGRIEPRATLLAVPDPLLGQRLIGTAADRSTMQAALDAVGVNPLVVAAFAEPGSEAEEPEPLRAAAAR